jgi:4-amino-4-deoxy-L-arabinose transferase-like glycosyltransferase
VAPANAVEDAHRGRHGGTATAARPPAGTCDSPNDASSPDATDRRLFRYAVVAAAVPFVATALAAIVAVGDDYLPAGDLAMTELHIRDVGRHEVLVGLYSRFDWSHPGPLQFYLVAPFYWLSGGSSIGMVLGALAINLASVVGILSIARRRGGPALVLCSLLGCLLIARTLGPEFLGDSWNLTLTVFPFALLAFLTWSMISGDAWALPVGAMVATFLVQTHVGFLATAVPLFVCGALVLVTRAWRERGDRQRWRGLVRASLVAAAVLAVLWLPPILDVLWHKPSNAGNAYRYFRDPGEPGHTVIEGWRVATGQFGLDPEWLTGKLPIAPITGESPFLHSSPLPLLLVPVVVAGALLWRRSREGRAMVMTVVLLLGLVILSVMRTAGAVQDYRLRYTWVPPLVASIAVLWAAWLALVGRLPRAERALVPALLAVAVVVAGANTVSGVRAGTPHEDDVEVVETLTAPLIGAYRDTDDPVVVEEIIGIAGPWYSRAVVLQLERHGIDARVTPAMGPTFSRSRVHDGGRAAGRLLVATGGDVEPLLDEPGVVLLSRWTPVPPETHDRLDRERQRLEARWAAGQVSAADYLTRSASIGKRMLGDHPHTTADDVAVFLQQPA